MMATQNVLQRLHHYVDNHQSRAIELNYTEQELHQYVSRLEKSVRSLQNQIKQYQTSIHKLQQPDDGRDAPLNGQARGTRERLQQLRATRNAYRRLISQEPSMPTAESPLPALLALRCTLRTIQQSKNTICVAQEGLIEGHQHLQLALESSEHTGRLSRGLQDRITKLNNEDGQQSKRRPADIASELVIEHQERRSSFRANMRSLVKAYNAFVSDRLAMMLAAEDLGGPIVGDALELEEESLEVGFTQQGKPKKVGHKTDAQEKKRLVRNSHIWGDEYARDRNGELTREADAAGTYFRDLTEDLLNAFAASNQTNAYVQVGKENAAVRFLIRANVVQFHPDDARRIRLRC